MQRDKVAGRCRMRTMFTTCLRSYPNGSHCLRSFSSVSEAIADGLARGRPFDVLAPSGAVLWAWEQR